MNTLLPHDYEASGKKQVIAGMRHPLAHRFRPRQPGRPKQARSRVRRPCVVPLALAELIHQHHPELLSSEPALLLFVAYCVSCWSGQDPMPAPYVFLRDLHAPSRNSGQVLDECREGLEAARVTLHVSAPSYWHNQARQVRLDLHATIRAFLDPKGWQLMSTDPLVDLLNPRRRPGSGGSKRRVALAERRAAQASVERCPDPLRKERLKRFAKGPSVRRQLNELLARDELLDELQADLPVAARRHNREVLAHLLQLSFYRPTEPHRHKRSRRIGARLSLGDLTKEVRRGIFQHDLEVDGRSMWLSFAPHVVGATTAAKIVGGWLQAGLDPWGELTAHCLDGAIPPGDTEALDEARRHIKLLGQMLLCGALSTFPKRKIHQYPTPNLGPRLKAHPVMADILARRDEIFERVWQGGETEFTDGQPLHIDLGRCKNDDHKFRQLCSQLTAAIERYECEAILGCYREIDRQNAARPRPKFRVRYDTHDGFAFYRDDWRCPYGSEIDSILRAGEQLMAVRYGIVVRFRLAHDPREVEGELLRMQREMKKACQEGLGRQLGGRRATDASR